MRNIVLALIPVVIVVLGFVLILGDPVEIPTGLICAVMFGCLVLSYILRGTSSGDDNDNSK